MKHYPAPLRPGVTAIAAVLALSSTPLLAQTAEASTEAPVLVTPPPVVISSAPPAAPSAPQIAVPSPTMRTVATPIVNTPDTATGTAPDTTAPAHVPPPGKMTQTRAQAGSAAAHAIALRTVEPRIIAPAQPVAVAKPTIARAAPNDELKTTTASRYAATPAAAPATTPQSPQTMSDDGMIAGISGLGLIALAGGAFAYARRTRRDRRHEEIDPAPVAETPTITAVAPVLAPAGSAYADSPRTDVPADFDISRFGRHTQAAYRGPSPDNPSLSLKRRLKRASFYDQRERTAASTTTQPIEPAQAPAAAPRPPEHADHIVSRMRPPARPRFRPITA